MQETRKTKSKLGSRQGSDESMDDCSLVIDLNKKEKQSVFDFNDDSEDTFGSKEAGSRKPLRETFKTSQSKPAGTSYASFVAGTQHEPSSSPSASTEFKNVVIVPDSPPATNGEVEDEKAAQDEVKILEKPEVEAPKKNELEMSIASITDNKSSDNVSESEAAVANLLQSAADSDRKRTVISQEETESAVNALLGESFDSFEGATDPANQQQVENMDEDVANVADDEAAAAVAGLAALGSPENTEDQWSRNQNAGKAQPEVTSAVEEKQMDESIENIAAEIRRSSTDSEDKSQEEIQTSSSENGAKVPKSDKPVPMETSPAKEPATARRKSRDVFDFPDDEEEAAKPASIAASKVSPAAPSVENIIEEAVKEIIRLGSRRRPSFFHPALLLSGR